MAKIDLKAELIRRVRGSVYDLKLELLADGTSPDVFADEIEVNGTAGGVEVVFLKGRKPKARAKAADGTQSDGD